MTAPQLRGSRVQCTACGQFFASVAVFDRHRVGEFAGMGGINTRRCLTVEEMQAQEWPKTEKGFWLRPAPRRVHSDHAAPSVASPVPTLQRAPA